MAVFFWGGTIGARMGHARHCGPPRLGRHQRAGGARVLVELPVDLGELGWLLALALRTGGLDAVGLAALGVGGLAQARALRSHPVALLHGGLQYACRYFRTESL